jgi:hypothetical protein
MVFEGTNTTGWAELMKGDIVGAAYTMYNAAFVGWFILILLLVYEVMIYMKTRSLSLTFITTIIFVSMFISAQLITTAAFPILAFMLVLMFASLLWAWFK